MSVPWPQSLNSRFVEFLKLDSLTWKQKLKSLNLIFKFPNSDFYGFLIFCRLVSSTPTWCPSSPLMRRTRGLGTSGTLSRWGPSLSKCRSLCSYSTTLIITIFITMLSFPAGVHLLRRLRLRAGLHWLEAHQHGGSKVRHHLLCLAIIQGAQQNIDIGGSWV